jgi:penicillin V acylase-like amidase (Ntn superfamily)
MIRLPLILWCVTCVAARGYACSTFRLAQDSVVVFGNNYDWHIDDGMVLVNKRGVQKTAVADSNPAQWVSRYGNVTVNQYGREMPHGGINEAGLAIGIMWLQETAYPRPDRRQAIGELEWVQYQLDNCATVAEVLATDSLIRIAPRGPAPIHFFVCDASGAYAAVEFLNAKTVHHTGHAMPVPVLTNNTYTESLGSFNWFAGGGVPLPAGGASLARFTRAAHLLGKSTPSDTGEAVARAFEILDNIAIRNYTAWSLVYDLKGRCMHLRTRRSPKIRSVCLDRMSFSCDKPVLMIDINARRNGDIAGAFAAYRTDANIALMKRTFAKTEFLSAMSPEEIIFNANLPETHTRCDTILKEF